MDLASKISCSDYRKSPVFTGRLLSDFVHQKSMSIYFLHKMLQAAAYFLSVTFIPIFFHFSDYIRGNP